MCCPTAGCCLQLTAQTLQDEVEFSSSLEGVQQIYDERVPHRLQDLSLCSRMGRVFSVAHYLCLQETKSGRGAWYNDDRDKLKKWKVCNARKEKQHPGSVHVPFSGPSWQKFSLSEPLEPSSLGKPAEKKAAGCCTTVVASGGTF